MFLNIPGEIKLSRKCRKKAYRSTLNYISQTCIDQIGWQDEWSTVNPHIWLLLLSPFHFVSICAVEAVNWTVSALGLMSLLCHLLAVWPQVNSLASLCLAALSIKVCTSSLYAKRVSRPHHKAVSFSWLKSPGEPTVGVFCGWQA